MSAQRFVAAIAERHGASTRRALGLTRTVIRRMRVAIARGGDRLTIAPRIELRVVSALRAAGASASRAHVSLPAPERTRPRTLSAPPMEPLLARARARGVREESAASPNAIVSRALAQPGNAPADRTPRASPAPRTSRVLRRQAPVTVEPPQSVRHDGWPPRAPMQPARAGQLTAVELDRLTDHIVHTIDRRIAAFRERQGRV
jgi:hypothetical protein